MADFQKQMWEEVETVLGVPPSNRENKKIESILVWFRQRSPIFKALEDDGMKDVIKNVKLHRFRRDTVIIHQWERGDCLYVVLKGSVSLYAKKEGEGEISQESLVRSHQERIVLFGTELSTLKAGRHFGESVMTGGKKERNATVISDEATLLVSIDGPLYQRSLASHNAEWKNKTQFVFNCPLFASWPYAYKTLLVENLRAHTFNFGNLVVKQNTLCHSVFFIAKGMGKVLVDPRVAAKQYNRIKPKQTVKQASTSEDNQEADLSKPLTVIEKRRRRQLLGFVAEESRQRDRFIQVAIIGQNDIIGDLEMVLDLPFYSTSVECMESLECYELDKPNFHRLIVKRNPETLEKINMVAIEKLKFREERLRHVPYYGLLLERATQDEDSAADSKTLRPKSVAKAIVGFYKGKKTTKNDFFKRLQGPVLGVMDKNAVPKSTSNTDNIGKKGDTQDQPDRRKDKKGKKQYTAEEFRALKKKVQSTGKLIRRISD